MSDRWTERLSEYIDGELSGRDLRELEAHLAECDGCRTVLGELREVLAEARSLEPLPPDVDLWPAIEARLAPRTSPGSSAAGAWRRWQVTLNAPQLAGAFAVVALLFAAALWTTGRAPWHVTRGPSDSVSPPLAADIGPAAPSLDVPGEPAAGAAGDREDDPVRAGSRIASPAGPRVVTAVSADSRYDATIAELQRILDQERPRLDPQTVRVLERNLAIIDQAVEEARKAVEADPASFYLRDHLARVMKQKVDLLRLATSIAGEQG